MSIFTEKQKELKEKAIQEAIFDAAVSIIKNSKSDSLKMHDIAEKVGISTGTLYNYFKNKEDLLCFVHRRLHDTIIKKIGEYNSINSSAAQRLIKIINTILDFCREYNAVFDVSERFGIDTMLSRNEKQTNFQTATATIENTIKDGIKSKEFRTVDTSTTATFVFYAIIGAVKVNRYLDSQEYLDKNNQKLSEIMIDYLSVRND